MAKRRILWGHPSKSKERLQEKLKKDKIEYRGTVGDLRYRNPKIVGKKRRDGKLWYHIIVDDI